jgi:hypothetical protein
MEEFINDVFHSRLVGFKSGKYSVYRQADNWSGNTTKITDFIVENKTGKIIEEIKVGKGNQMEAEIKVMELNKGEDDKNG